MRILTLLCAAALAVCAQNVDTVNVRFETPVVVGGTIMPAGDCNIQILRSSSATVTLTMRSSEGPVANILVTRFQDPTTDSIYNPHVVLRKSGSAYHFERLLLADRTGFQVLSAE